MASKKIGKRFVNRERIVHASARDMIRWLRTRERGHWPAWVEVEPARPLAERITGGELVATFVNHSTVLLQFEGLNVLTDPVFSEAVGPFGRIGPKRHHAPGVPLDALPPIDLVLISHDHYDHLDAPSVRAIADRSPDARFLVPLGNAARLRRWGVERVLELDWWEEARHGERAITFVPAQHFSGRALHDRDATLWGGFVIDAGPAGLVYFAGDTGMGAHFSEIRARFGPLRLALLPIGAYLPRWFMRGVHIDPAEAVEAFRTLEAERAIGIHFGTFRLADEARGRPAEDLRRACLDQGVAEGAFTAPAPGESLSLPPVSADSRLRRRGA